MDGFGVGVVVIRCPSLVRLLHVEETCGMAYGMLESRHLMHATRDILTGRPSILLAMEDMPTRVDTRLVSAAAVAGAVVHCDVTTSMNAKVPTDVSTIAETHLAVISATVHRDGVSPLIHARARLPNVHLPKLRTMVRSHPDGLSICTEKRYCLPAVEGTL